MRESRRLKSYFKGLIERNKWFRYVPNSLTLCNSLCGFAAILNTLQAYYHIGDPKNIINVMVVSSWIIIFAMVFDALDGFAARIFNAASMHGIQMDSLADMVTFGVAPAVIAAILTHCLKEEMSRFQNILVYCCCSIYLGCAALRLATYNVHAILEKKSGEKFTGLPSPGAAAAICSLMMFYANFSGPVKYLAVIAPVYAAAVGLLMVSNIPYQHIGKWLFSVRRSKRRMVVLVLVIVFIALFKSSAIFILVNIYIFSGPVMAILIRIKNLFTDKVFPKTT